MTEETPEQALQKQVEQLQSEVIGMGSMLRRSQEEARAALAEAERDRSDRRRLVSASGRRYEYGAATFDFHVRDWANGENVSRAAINVSLLDLRRPDSAEMLWEIISRELKGALLKLLKENT